MFNRVGAGSPRGRSAAGDGRDDADDLAVPQGRREPVEEPDVLVGDEDVHEAPQVARLVVETLAETGVRVVERAAAPRRRSRRRRETSDAPPDRLRSCVGMRTVTVISGWTSWTRSARQAGERRVERVERRRDRRRRTACRRDRVERLEPVTGHVDDDTLVGADDAVGGELGRASRSSRRPRSHRRCPRCARAAGSRRRSRRR